MQGWIWWMLLAGWVVVALLVAIGFGKSKDGGRGKPDSE